MYHRLKRLFQDLEKRRTTAIRRTAKSEVRYETLKRKQNERGSTSCGGRHELKTLMCIILKFVDIPHVRNGQTILVAELLFFVPDLREKL